MPSCLSRRSFLAAGTLPCFRGLRRRRCTCDGSQLHAQRPGASDALGIKSTAFFGVEGLDDYGRGLCVLSSGPVVICGEEEYHDVHGFAAFRGVLGIVSSRESGLSVIYRGLRSIQDVSTDLAQCIYAVGYTLDPKPVLRKMSPSGNTLWSVTLSELGFGLAVKALPCARVAWAYTYPLVAHGQRGYTSAVQCVSSSGRAQWTTALPTLQANESIRIQSIADNRRGGVIVAGNSELVDVENELFSIKSDNRGGEDHGERRRRGVIMSLDPSGRMEWTQYWSEGDRDRVVSVDVSAGVVIAAGRSGAGGIVRTYSSWGRMISELRVPQGIVAVATANLRQIILGYTSRDLREIVYQRRTEDFALLGEVRDSLSEASPLESKIAVDSHSRIWVCGSRRRYRSTLGRSDVDIFVSTIQ